MCAFCLVNRHRHTQNTNGPPGYNATHEDHGEISSRTLEDRAYCRNKGSELDSTSAAESIYCQAGREGTDGGFFGHQYNRLSSERAQPTTTRKCTVYSTNNRRRLRGVEEFQKVGRSNHIGHDTGVITKEETSCGCEGRQGNREALAHVVSGIVGGIVDQ